MAAGNLYIRLALYCDLSQSKALKNVAKIFISYRREDSAAHVGRLFEELRRKFGRSAVFMDIDSIEPGQPFAERIVASMKGATVVLVAIGRRWLEVTDSDGRRRIDNHEDFVRLEIETALASNLRVIPVLFGGAVPPRADALPETLRPLAALQATEISDARFPYDTSRLIRSIYKGIKTRERLRIFAMRPPILTSTLLLVCVLLGGMVFIWSEWIQISAIFTTDRKSIESDKGEELVGRRPGISETATESPFAPITPKEKPDSSFVLNSEIDVETLKLKRQIDLWGQITDLIKTGRALGTIGVQLADVSNNKSVYISSVVQKGAAVRAGLLAGDVILTFDGKPIRERGQAIFEILKWAPGSTHMVAIRRGNRQLAYPIAVEVMGKSDLSDLEASIEDRAGMIDSMQEQKNR